MGNGCSYLNVQALVYNGFICISCNSFTVESAIVPAATETPRTTHVNDATVATPADFWRRITPKDILYIKKSYFEVFQWRFNFVTLSVKFLGDFQS